MINELLDKTTEIIKDYDKQIQTLKANGEFFNIFNIVSISTKEVYMCKFLAELLNPKGCHGHDNIYLDLFCKKFMPDIEINTKNVNIKIEAQTKNLDDDKQRRRIDIVLVENGGYYIPIEVKINADEQEEQCHDYLEQTANWYKEHNISYTPMMYFLTRDGYPPTSINNIAELQQVIPMSWHQICEWLAECIDNSKTTDAKVVLKQYKNAIEEFLNSYGEKTMKDVMDLLITDENYMKSAELISDTISEACRTLWQNFKEQVKKQYEQKPFHDEDPKLSFVLNKYAENRIECIVFDTWDRKGRSIDCLIAVYDNNKKYISERDREKLCDVSELANREKFEAIINKALDFLKNKN